MRHRLLTAIICSLIIAFTTANSVFAYTLSPADYAGNGVRIYTGLCTATTSNLSLSGNSNIEKALNFMLQNGFSLAGAAGIIGNWIQESGVRSDIIQGGATAGPNYQMVPGVGFGLAQWTSGGRQQALAAFMAKSGLPITDFGGQLQFFLQEFKQSYSALYQTMIVETDPVQAAIDFNNGYEGSADSQATVRAVRGGNAQKVYDEYQGSVTSTTPNSTGTSSSSSTTNNSTGCGNSSATQAAGSVVWYSQTDPAWANTTYAGSTIGKVGDGPTAMAIALASLINKTITPDQVAAVAGQQTGGTSSMTNLINGVNTKWGVSISTTPVTITQAMQFVQAGSGYVIIAGKGAVPFTNTAGGHFVVLTAVSNDNQLTIYDPLGNSDGHQETADYSQSIIQTGATAFYEVPN